MSIVITEYDRSAIKIKALIAFASYYIVFALMYPLIKRDGSLGGLLLSAFYVIPILTALIATVWAGHKSNSYSRLWRLIAHGMFFWLIGAVLMGYYAASVSPSNIPAPSIADLLSVAYLPIMLGIMFSLGRIRKPFDTEKRQFLANSALMSFAMFLLLYNFVLLPVWHQAANASVIEKTFTILYPLIDWVILVSLILASRRLFESQIEGWVLLLIVGFSCSIFADAAIYAYGYAFNPWTVLAMASTANLIALAAIDETTHALIGMKTRKQAVSSEITSLTQKPFNTLLVPLLTMLTIPLVWHSATHNATPNSTHGLIVIASIMLGLSIYRNHLLASDNAVLFSKALRDSLTGLNNHRYFQEILDNSLHKARRTKSELSLVTADIDDFTQVNTKYGHAFGDKVLTTISKAMLGTLRENDEACRLGGDEFAFVLPGTTKSEAHIFAEQLKQNISSAIRNSLPGHNITLSLGISSYPSLSEDRDTLVHTADGALYWSKFQGKDSICVYDPDVVEVLSADERATKAEAEAYLDTVKSLAEAVDARDAYTRLHSQGVSTYAGKLASKFGLDKRSVSKIEAAGLLHDVGKIGMPDNILGKPGRLTDEEMLKVKEHPALSAHILQSTILRDMVPAVRGHHERWDGNGYPDGLKGTAIPLEARILAIADTFDAMTTDRPYRKAMPIDEALAEIERCSGAQFDPQLVAVFLSLFPHIGIELEGAEDTVIAADEPHGTAYQLVSEA